MVRERRERKRERERVYLERYSNGGVQCVMHVEISV
jgi:hypothetical protein